MTGREPSPHERRNGAAWDAEADAYQAHHGEQLGRASLAWGVWAIPEAELHVLGDVRDKDVLELGCGAAQWSIALAGHGARCTGLDISARQLEHARRLITQANVDFPLVHASAEDVPLPDAGFDIVFCDHGAMTFADPQRTVPEAARLLRPGGLLAFNAESPLHSICWDDENVLHDAMMQDYFETHEVRDGDFTSFTLPTGEWIRLFRRHGFSIEDLIELRPPPGGTTTYNDFVSYDWARRWPAEQIWRVRRGA